LIRLSLLDCGYKDQKILKDINLEIKNHLTILGVNGSGKSTLAKTICGLLEYNGEIILESQNLNKLSLKQKAKTISYIPAKLDVYDEFISVDEFVLLGRFAYKDSFFSYTQKDKTIRDESIKLLKIEHLKNHTLNSLSSGEQQLVQIAAALTQQSKIIIFDEPTANLDPHNTKIIAQHIKTLKEYHNIILITHDLHLAKYVGSEIGFIKAKKLLHFKNSFEFFDEKNLQELYGVEFNSLAVRYD